MKKFNFEQLMKSSSRNVVFIMTSTGFGGLEMNCLKVIKSLSIDYTMYVVCQEGSRFHEEAKELDVQIMTLSKVKKYFDFKSAKKIASLIQKHKISTVLTTYRKDLDLVYWTKRSINFRHIHQQQMQIGIPKKGLLQRMRYKNIDCWLAPLIWLKEETIEKTNVNPKHIEIVPLGVDVTRFQSIKINRSAARTKFGLTQDKQILGVLGRFDEKKGQLFVLQALQQLVKNNPNLHLLLVGEPTINDDKGRMYYEQILQFIEVNNLSEFVTIAPFTKEIEVFYQAIDLFIMASSGETYGMVTLESLLSETPVLGTNSGGTPELLSYVSNSSLYQVNNLASFVEAFGKLEFNEGNNKLCSQIIAEHFSLKKEMEGWIKAINAGG